MMAKRAEWIGRMLGEPRSDVQRNAKPENFWGMLAIFEKKNEDEGAYPAVSSARDSAFLLSEAVAKRIMVPLEDFFQRPDQT